ncbi:hypothetical protein F9U64_14595 [Gracilibacillus oryzae]|uniref:DUF6036 domain-containing protein n=1 Tax=Gracilibacillus oryzae TaxID=1672701 RepID=A0A7C8GS23_9BACI|nr:DUF6036 family nucleotidyltransferase [Gracilibacillus oryzae]KAB8129868.1 hypothetical protein F9U64_14595 [Gracilibacillus oryzae]
MITVDEIKKNMPKLKRLSKFERQLEFAALITAFMSEKNIKPIIVGGLAVEIYTRNDYHTHDIDFVSDGWEYFDKLLIELGFTKIEREWYHTELEIAVEIPSNFLEGSEERVIELELPGGKSVYLISVEDIIIHRLEGIAFSTTYPKEDEDYEWAHRMFLIHKADIDFEYFHQQAKAAKVSDLIQEWQNSN